MKLWLCLLLSWIVLANPGSGVAAEQATPRIMTASDLADFPNPAATARIAYGAKPLQFADLRVPSGPGPHPVMILIHGGCWLSSYDITHIGKLADGFAKHGFATWAIEYRRVGDEGGGWPGTFEDIASAADYLPAVAAEYALDLSRVIAAGHSARGAPGLVAGGQKSIFGGQEICARHGTHTIERGIGTGASGRFGLST